MAVEVVTAAVAAEMAAADAGNFLDEFFESPADIAGLSSWREHIHMISSSTSSRTP